VGTRLFRCGGEAAPILVQRHKRQRRLVGINELFFSAQKVGDPDVSWGCTTTRCPRQRQLGGETWFGLPGLLIYTEKRIRRKLLGCNRTALRTSKQTYFLSVNHPISTRPAHELPARFLRFSHQFNFLGTNKKPEKARKTLVCAQMHQIYEKPFLRQPKSTGQGAKK